MQMQMQMQTAPTCNMGQIAMCNVASWPVVGVFARIGHLPFSSALRSRSRSCSCSRWRWCWQCGFVFGVSQRQYAYVVKFKSSTPLRQLQLNHSMSIARSR
jgi:hypothetical protein